MTIFTSEASHEEPGDGHYAARAKPNSAPVWLQLSPRQAKLSPCPAATQLTPGRQPGMKKPPRFAPGRFSFRGQRTRFKRQRGQSLAGLLIWWSGSGCGESQSLDFGAQAALVTSSLVFVEDALVGNDVHHGLHFGKQLCGFGLVASCNGFFDVFHSSAVFGAQRRVRGVDFDVLADAFTAGSKTGVFLFGFSGCHI